MTGRWKWLAAGLGVLVLAAAMAPWTFSGAAVRQEIARQVRDTLGLTLVSDGRTTLALLPRPRIKVADVVIQDRDGSLRMQAGILRGDLRILPMFAGRLELNSVTLVSPQLDIDIEAKPLTSEGAIARASEARPASPEAESADSARLGRISIQHGIARVRSASRGLDARFEDIDLTLDWPSLRAPAGVKANFLWNGEAVDAAAWLGRPTDLLRGDKSPVSVKLVSPSLTLAANGSVFATGGMRYQGKLTATAPSLKRVAELAGARIPLPGPMKQLSLVATARTTGNSLSLSDMHMSLDGNAYDGALMYATERGVPALSGTLATDLLNIATVPQELPQIVSGPADLFDTASPSAASLRTVDADLRVSATRVRFGRIQAKDVGFNLQINDGRAELSVAEAGLYGGLLKGRIRAEPAPGGIGMRCNLAFSRVDSAAFLAEGMRSQRFSGEASGDLAITGEGDTIARIANSLTGNMRLTLTNGEVSGLDLEQALRRLEKRPLSIASEMRSGRTAFTQADIALAFDKGDVAVRQAEVRGPGVEFSVEGKASIPGRSLSLSIRAQTATTGTTGRSRPQLAVDVVGNWDDPNLVLDTQSLIRRSEAAAPLFRSLSPPTPTVVPLAGADQEKAN
jgi:AsmA protein